jgi:hypothetical protein
MFLIERKGVVVSSRVSYAGDGLSNLCPDRTPTILLIFLVALLFQEIAGTVPQFRQ